MDGKQKNNHKIQILKNVIEQFYPEIEQLKELYQNKGEIKPVITIGELEKLCEGNERLEKLLKETIESFYRYTETICAYQKIFSQDITDEEVNRQLAELEITRSRVHNALIDNVVILARTLERFGKDSSWIEKLGPKTNRVAYGKLAIENTYLKLLELEEGEKNDE